MNVMLSTKPLSPTLRFSFALSLVAFAAAGSAQRVTLRLNLPIGKSMKYSMTSKVASANPGGGPGGMNLDMTQQMTTSVGATAKTAKGLKVRTKMDQVKITAPKGSMMAGQASQTAAQLKGTYFDAIYDSRARMVPGSMTGTAMGGRASQMGGMNFGFLGAEYPAGPVSAGATWSTNVDFSKIMGGAVPGMAASAGKSTIPVKYKLVKVESRAGKSIAHLSYTMKGSVNMNMGGGNQKAAAMAMVISMDMKGTILVDVSTGAPISGSSNGTTNVSINNSMNIGQKITVNFKQL